jgi:hypothetical protein
MQYGLERNGMTRASRPRTIAALVLSALGFGLTLYVFYPGIMTYDALYVYGYIGQSPLGDWQSPLMTLLWSLIDPIAPGAGSMFLLIATLYWLAFSLIALTVARRSWFALALPILALTPPAFVLVGIIWRDVLFAAAWLLAAALVFAAEDRKAHSRYWIQAIALVLLAFGVLLRPNALPAAPILATFVLWPSRWQLKRAVLTYLPALAIFYALVPVVYYGMIGAKQEHPLHSLIVFDLGGITHFAKQNQFLVAWTPAETALLTERCYQPTEWNFYWNMGPCQFVMSRLEGEKIFGTPTLVASWRQAVINHPIAYLRHRMTFMATFLAGSNLTMWTPDLNDPSKIAFADNAALMALKAVHDALKPTFLFRQGAWLVLCVGLCALGWRGRDTSAGAFILGVCGSAVVYVATYFFVGVASDFRYSYWAVLAGITGCVVLLPRLFAPRA